MSDIEKIEMKTKDLVAENVEKIAALFPNCITEKKDADGNLKKCINFDVLRQMLTPDALNETESYEFTWVGKNASIAEANRPIEKTLRPSIDESVNWENTENLYIEGDNLDALKLLEKAYLGSIKIIYIDPPYNRKNKKKNLIYLDKYSISAKEWDSKQIIVDEYGNRLLKNKVSNGRFHSDWCSMIYPRLLIARNLLCEDGIIFISIDDDEVSNMIQICDDIFGEENKIANIVITSNSSKNNSDCVSVIHEYLLCYAKKLSAVPKNWKVRRNNSEEYLERAKFLVKNTKTSDEIHHELLQLVKYPRFYDFDHFTYADKKGVYQTSDLTAPDSSNKYDILHPVSKKPCSFGTRGWGYSPENIRVLLENDMIEFGADETTIPRLKNYLLDGDNLYVVPKSVVFFDSQGSTKWIKQQDFDFDYAKAIEYMKWILSLYPQNDVTVLDFFSGSGTTADAVMRLNADDGGKRRFILVQLPELCDKKAKTYNPSYNTISKIGIERIKIAGEELCKNRPIIAHEFDTGFRVLKVDDWNKKDVCHTVDNTKQEDLESFGINLKEDRSDLDFLFGCLIEEGLMLNKQIKVELIDGIDVYTYDGDWLIGCFADNVPESIIQKIASRKPRVAVFKDSSFADSQTKINVSEIFKTETNEYTRVKVI